MTNALIQSLKEDVLSNNCIDGAFYDQFDVKRGLRNADGSGVVAGLSRISSVVGVKKEGEQSVPVEGELKYRGIPIQELAQSQVKGNYLFEQAVFLLMVGRLPNAEDLQTFSQELARFRTVNKAILDHTVKAIPSSNIMNKLQTVISALYTVDQKPETTEPFENFEKSVALIAKVPMIVAYSYLAAYQPEAEWVIPPEGLSMAEAFLYMLRQGQEASDLEKTILDLCLMLHAEHGGGNNSTFTTYVVTSSGTDLYAAITSAVGSLKGPLHGAANKKVMDMMSDIKDNVSDWGSEKEVRSYLEKIVRKEVYDKTGKIYGLGHAVYTKSDPRALILKEKAAQLATEKSREDEFKLYCLIESLGPQVFKDVKGSDKVIAPNVDFFSGFVYDCLSIPVEVYTPLFAMGRSAGWCAHRIEELLSGKRVIRPGYKFVGQDAKTATS